MPQSSTNAGGPPTWVEIKKAVLNYQAFLRSQQTDPQLRRKAFLLDEETINELFQLGSGRKAIRLYIGSEPDGTGLRLFPVACQEKTDGSGKKYYEDINIPKTLPGETTALLTETATVTEAAEEPLPDPYETRPCPTECSSTNFLNP